MQHCDSPEDFLPSTSNIRSHQQYLSVFLSTDDVKMKNDVWRRDYIIDCQL